MSTLAKLRDENTGVVYADASKPDFTVRFRTTRSKKTLNAVQVDNVQTEIIYNDNNAVTVGSGVNANDAVSVRIRVSGADASASRKGVILAALAAQINTWYSQNVFAGFNPTSAPVVPAV